MSVPHQSLMNPRDRRTAYPGLVFEGRAPRRRRAADPHLVADGAYWLLRLTGWIAVNLLVVLGTAVVLFSMLANLDVESFCLHVQGLASHYLAAAPDARASFGRTVTTGFLVAFAGVSAFRLGALRAPAPTRETTNG